MQKRYLSRQGTKKYLAVDGGCSQTGSATLVQTKSDFRLKNPTFD